MTQESWAVRRLEAFIDLADTELLALATLLNPRKSVERGTVLRHEGQAGAKIYLLHSGWTASSVLVSNGGRQLLTLHMPGDMLGLPGLAFSAAPDTIFAITTAVVSVVEEAALARLFEAEPRLAMALFLISQEERVLLMDRLAALGRTSAVSRLAAIILQIEWRLRNADPHAGPTFELPLKQIEVADLLGLTPIHVSRTLTELRAAGIMTWKGRTITIHDRAALRNIADLPEREIAQMPSWLPRR